MRAGLALTLLVLVARTAAAQTAPPLPAYVPPPTASPLAPLPGAPGLPEPVLGAVRATSSDASNISAADTRSPIAPALPTPEAGGDDADAYLRAAAAAIAAGQTGAAQEALERAESRLLDRDVAPSDAARAITGTRIGHIAAARQALSTGDRQQARAEIAASGK